MKKITLIFSFLAILGISAISQVYVNGKNINAMKEVHYCTLLNLKLNGKAYIDYGQIKGFLKPHLSEKITDSNGKPILFNNTMHVINYMYSNGWELAFYEFDTTNTEIIFKKMENTEVYKK